MTDLITNFAKATVSLGYTSTDLTIVLTGGHGAKFPLASSSDNTTWFNLVWYNSTDYPDPADDTNVEIVRVTNRSTDTLTVTRAQEGTTATNKNTAGKTYKMILAPTRKTILDLSVVEPAEYAATITHVSANSYVGTAFTVGTFMKYGDIKKITARANYTMATLYQWTALASVPTTGITPLGTTIPYYSKSGSIFKQDFAYIDNEIIKVTGTAAGKIFGSRGVKNTSASFHDHNAVLTKAVNGLRISIYPNSAKSERQKLLEINNVLLYSGFGTKGINNKGTVIRLTTAPRNLNKDDYVTIIDTTSETAIVQNAYGSVRGSTFDNTIFVKGSLSTHGTAKVIQKLMVYDIDQPYKGSSNTLYGHVHIDERIPAGGTITIILGITCDKYGSIALS